MTASGLSSMLSGRFPYLGIVVSILVLDRWSKSVIQKTFDLGEAINIISGFFDFIYVRNTGIAFGLFSSINSPIKGVLLSLLAGSAAVMIIVFSLRSPPEDRVLQLSLAAILAGALGNLYDRLAYGYVVDFIHVHAGSYYWPAFNLADAAISFGVISLAVQIIRHENKNYS